MSDDLRTAYLEWEVRWANDDGRADWLEPEPVVEAVVPLLLSMGAARALDVGCGVGRHARLLACAGFQVSAIDASRTGLDHARELGAGSGLAVDYQVGDFTSLAFEPESFDYALAWNVVYHGDGDSVRQAFSEARRVLAPGGLFQATMLSKRSVNFGRGREVRPDTFILDDPERTEKAHAHFYCNARELLDLLDGFEIMQLRDRDQTSEGDYHWEFVAEKTG